VLPPIFRSGSLPPSFSPGSGDNLWCLSLRVAVALPPDGWRAPRRLFCMDSDYPTVLSDSFLCLLPPPSFYACHCAELHHESLPPSPGPFAAYTSTTTPSFLARGVYPKYVITSDFLTLNRVRNRFFQVLPPGILPSIQAPPLNGLDCQIVPLPKAFGLPKLEFFANPFPLVRHIIFYGAFLPDSKSFPPTCPPQSAETDHFSSRKGEALTSPLLTKLKQRSGLFAEPP